MEFLRTYQLNIMLVLIGLCGALALLVPITRSISTNRRRALFSVALCSTMLLVSDRYAYLFRGDTSALGWWMVRISNYLVFFFTLAVIFAFNAYLTDLFTHEGGLGKVPKRLRIAGWFFVLGEILLIVSQFTGWYYTFDQTNHYQRAGGFMFSFTIPLVMLILQLSVILQHGKRLRRGLRISLILFSIVPLLAALAQVFVYGLSLFNISIVGMCVVLYIFALLDINKTVNRANELEKKNARILFEQTAQALADAIDAKDQYTHGHSTRVAEYSAKIAKLHGMGEEECNEIYSAALLHDVGKIGIPDKIINKRGKLTSEEYAEIKKHPVIGNQILSRISQSPYLSIGAHYHHERYDGKGYPDGLKGEDIPEIARIIAVADAYDAMTSKRSYRDPFPQQEVREELVKGMGIQFDPDFATLMLHLIDLDAEYEMKEREEIAELGGNNEMHFDEYRSTASEGIVITDVPTRIRLNTKKDEGYPYSDCIPTMIIFDALDGRIHNDDARQESMQYFEYGVVRFNGEAICEAARKIESSEEVYNDKEFDRESEQKEGTNYEVEAVKYRDHMRIRLDDGCRRTELIMALPDSARFVYIALTGEHCMISNVKIEKTGKKIGPSEIPRIAEEISYITGPAGDIPNVQVDGWRSAFSEGIPVKDNVQIRFHSMSLPTARLIWHCPYVSIYYSDNGQVNGPHFREFVLVRLDGENWDSDAHAKNKIVVNKNEGFDGWEAWKEQNRQGMDCLITVRMKGNTVVVVTENSGIYIKSITTLQDKVPAIYAALTGDQCAITNIRIQ